MKQMHLVLALAAIMVLTARVHAQDESGSEPVPESGSEPVPESGSDSGSDSGSESVPQSQRRPQQDSGGFDFMAQESTPTDAAAQAQAEAAQPTLPTIPADPAPAEAPPEDATILDEVVVTAQKREQRAVEVPINLSSIDRDDVQRSRIEQVRDVAGFVPNMDIKEQVPGAIPVVTIRGVGLDDFSSTNSPAAGIYVDQVTLSSLALMSFDMYDMERIEVLKGPQGTLYGRNSNAGAINVITARPTQNREASVRLGYGSYDAKDFEGMFNQPLGDTLAVRFATKIIRQDEGYWKSRAGENEPYNGNSASYTSDRPVVRDIGKRDIVLGRTRVAWEPMPELTVDLKVEGLRQRSEMGQPEFFGTNCSMGSQPVDPDNCSDFLGYKDTDRDPYLGDWRGEFPYHIDQMGETLTVGYDFGWAALTSVTAHIDFERFFHIDVDGTPADEFEFFQGDTVDQKTQELRLDGDSDLGAWLLGAFVAQDVATVDTPGNHQHLLQSTSRILADQETNGEAVFANVDWKLGALVAALDRFTVTTGLRLSHETRDYVGGTTWTPPTPPVIENTFQDSSIEDDSVSWKAGLNFMPTPASLLYASISEGTKSGGYFCGVTSNQRQLEPYAPEELTAIEVGGKLAGTVALNASVFHYDYKLLQTFMRDGSAPVQFVSNIPEATIDGVDLDTTLRVLDGLTLMAGVGLLRTELGAFLGPDGPDLDAEPDPHPAGNKAANAPELTWNLLTRYEVPIGSTSLVAAIQGDAHYAEEAFKEATNDPLIKSGEYTIFNARTSVLSAGREWEAALWGRNVTDERYVVQGADIAIFGMGNHNYNAPRTYGIDFIYNFGAF